MIKAFKVLLAGAVVPVRFLLIKNFILFFCIICLTICLLMSLVTSDFFTAAVAAAAHPRFGLLCV